MNKNTSRLIVFLVIVASFFAGAKIALRFSDKSEKVLSERIESTPTLSLSEKQTTPTPAAFFSTDKTAYPQVKFFVMSFCPFGNQAEASLNLVYDLLKDKVSWQPFYVLAKDSTGSVSSLHGEQEFNQDLREICLFKDEISTSSAEVLSATSSGQLSRWWNFVSLVNNNCTSTNADSCWKKQALEIRLDANKITTCTTQNRSAIIEEEIAEMQKYNVRSSPTVIINDKEYFGGRAPEDYKTAICSAFENLPPECNQTLGLISQPLNSGCGN